MESRKLSKAGGPLVPSPPPPKKNTPGWSLDVAWRVLCGFYSPRARLVPCGFCQSPWLLGVFAAPNIARFMGACMPWKPEVLLVTDFVNELKLTLKNRNAGDIVIRSDFKTPGEVMDDTREDETFVKFMKRKRT